MVLILGSDRRSVEWRMTRFGAAARSALWRVLRLPLAVVLLIGLVATACESKLPNISSPTAAATSALGSEAPIQGSGTARVSAAPAGTTRLPVTSQMALPLIYAAHVHSDRVTVLAWSPDGHELASAAGAAGSKDSTIRVVSRDGTGIATLRGHTQPVTSLAWSPDGSLLASGSFDGTIRLWDSRGILVRVLDAGAPSADLPWHSSQPLFSLAWSPDGQFLASGGVDFGSATHPNPPNVIPGVARLWRTDGTLVRTLDTQRTAGKFLNLAWSRDGSRIAAGAVDYGIWRSDGTLVARLWPGGSPVWGMAWSPDGNTIAFGDENGTLALFDAHGTSLAEAQHRGPINHLAFSPDGRVLAISDGNLELRHVSDLTRPGVSLGRLAGAGPAWSPSGFLAAGAQPSLWDARGVLVGTLPGCATDTLTLAWSPDGSRLAGGSDGGEVCIWRAGP